MGSKVWGMDKRFGNSKAVNYRKRLDFVVCSDLFSLVKY